MMYIKLASFLTILPSLVGGVPTTGPHVKRAGCAQCEDVAHGFASLNGGTYGGKGGQIVTVTTYADLKKYAGATEPYIIRVSGTIVAEPKGYEVPIKSFKTIIGVGQTGHLLGGGFNINSQRNIIIRNLEISDTYDPTDYNGKGADWDGIQVDNGTNIWIDHVKLARMRDGLIDLRKDTDYVTVSSCLLSEHNKAFGIGWTPNVISKMTINDNFFNSTNQRGPSADNLKYCHMYNNYMLNVTSYGNYARGETELLVETSYYERVNDPVVAGPKASIKSNWLKFKDCTGDIHLDVDSHKVFKASKFYSYELKDPYDLPTTIPPFVGPRPEIGI
ncbi:hypothetical protein H072_7894 [Dactylellina haptotyla CBS 200.50]|uniref:Pectate lyase domain-containing protein n=1 Tax=Dactylellina haptotyla (strain CBS 200.50) TaxID=1284197 RepID=S8A6G2_DACHA|nr:hypothetical protein H072_7894 [Dactylellina haptotyla CBS 200.50]